MPAPSSSEWSGITKFTNCRLARGDKLEPADLWFSSKTGTILSSQSTFFSAGALPDRVIDLQGRIVSPGMIDVQLNGAYGFNFSSLPESMMQYAKTLRDINKRLVETGVTSYTPTLTSQKSELYHKVTGIPRDRTHLLSVMADASNQVLPILRSKKSVSAQDGSESLGVHCEGPFLNPTKNGIHDVNVLIEANGFDDIEACYGTENLGAPGIKSGSNTSAVKMVTIAPEQGNMSDLIPQMRERGIICSVGHSEATYEEASKAVAQGATMITHLFNAMRPLHHRNPGIFGVLGTADAANRPYFGIIADGVHLHPTAIKIAFNAHPEGFILITDSMPLVGLPDGRYPWMNGEVQSTIIKKGPTLRLEGTDKIAGSCITLMECVNNFLEWSISSIPQALKAVTATPAAMLEIEDRKGSLNPGADADLVVFSETKAPNGAPQLVIDEVWKFGILVYERDGANIPEPTSPLSPKGRW
ncbi:uncharacterized protein E0L32_005904 [Thyridium curvatum]|uniref:N-acetylglucosamine-6-phosphate deacetylase n=1 Tax=Thyridium curvatum TaxID=1093900 RepID=A0A507B9H2_9PEZI|nr:uncharacterized protein E0L32_005904 [Thyridium curvatum]TPX13701.1 hypothetical protein E0L32_005904 [Thyridium curvatum]